MIETAFPTLFKSGLISLKSNHQPVYRSIPVDISGEIILRGRYKAPKKPRKKHELKSPFWKRGPMTSEQLLKHRRKIQLRRKAKTCLS